MAFTATDWTIDRQTGNIRYIGADHDFDTGTPSYATVIEFHRALQALADNASSTGNDDELDITDNTPSDRSTNNIIELKVPYNIDDASSEHLYDGSIIQNNGDDIYDGIVNFGNASVQIQIIQNGAVIADDWWNKSTLIITPSDSASVGAATMTDSDHGMGTDTYIGYTIYNLQTNAQGIISEHSTTVVTASMYDDNGADHTWDSGDNYLMGIPLNGDATAGISHRFMIKTREGGADIDGRRLIGTSRRFGNTYGEFNISSTSRGNNVLALSDATDLNNSTTGILMQTYDQFTNTTAGFDASQDVDLNLTNEEYYSKWNVTGGGATPASPTINDLYEWGKWITRQSSDATLYGVNGELFRGITLQILYDGLTSTFDESSYLVWGTNVIWATPLATPGTVGEFYNFSVSGAVGQLLALDDDTTTGNAIFAIESGTVVDTDVVTRADGTAADGFTVGAGPLNTADSGGVGLILADDGVDTVWIQLLKGAAPVNNIPMWETSVLGIFDADISAGYALADTTITDREPLITKPFIGASTGSSIIGGYGIGIEADDLTSSDILFDLTNAQITPPNNVTVSVSGLIVSEDYVTVSQRGYRFAYDAEDVSVFTVDEIITFSGAITATCRVAEVVDQDPVGYIIVSEALSGTFPDTAPDNAVMTGGSSGATAAINGAVVSDIDKRQLSLATTLSGNPDTSVVVNEVIPTDTPSSGVLRVQDNNGFYRKLNYTSYVTSTFTVTDGGTDEDVFNVVGATGGAGAAGNNVYIGYLDELAATTTESFISVYSADRNLFVRVRDGGGTPIKTFESTVTMGSSGGSSAAIRTTDL